ncbi:unnamed protein product [Lampetra fluviatilis]
MSDRLDHLTSVVDRLVMVKREEEGAGAARLELEPPLPLTTRRGENTKGQQPPLPLIEQQVGTDRSAKP